MSIRPTPRREMMKWRTEEERDIRHACMLVACILLKRMKHTAEHDSTRCTATLQAAMHACTTLTACSYTRSHTSSLFFFLFTCSHLTQATLRPSHSQHVHVNFPSPCVGLVSRYYINYQQSSFCSYFTMVEKNKNHLSREIQWWKNKRYI